MKRQVSLEEISDGKLYMANDMVKADCGGCEGCSACCRGMGDSIVLDPLDVFRLSQGTSCTFQELLKGPLALGVVDGIILPHLNMEGDEERCFFLNEEGRCSIHAHRPGICRMFPLGRVWEGREFRYFLQVHECPKPGKTKVKVKNWMDTPNLKAYEHFVKEWHSFVKDFEAALETESDPTYAKNMNMFLLNTFYMQPFSEADFYEEFERRMEFARESLGV